MKETNYAESPVIMWAALSAALLLQRCHFIVQQLRGGLQNYASAKVALLKGWHWESSLLL